MPVFLVVLAVACNNAQPEKKTSAGMVFVFNDETSVDDYVYASYIPLENLKKSKAKLVSGEYVRYHKANSKADSAIIFSRKYIRDLCLQSRCIREKIYDAEYGFVWEYRFPEAEFGFYRDCYDKLFVYSWKEVDGDVWTINATEDGSTVSDVESALWGFYEYLDDSVEVDSGYIPAWDIIRSYYNNSPVVGIKQGDSCIVYMVPNGELTFVRSIGENGWNTFSKVLFQHNLIDKDPDLRLLERIFMDELRKIWVSDGDFAE